jgi:hypothetical protein
MMAEQTYWESCDGLSSAEITIYSAEPPYPSLVGIEGTFSSMLSHDVRILAGELLLAAIRSDEINAKAFPEGHPMTRQPDLDGEQPIGFDAGIEVGGAVSRKPSSVKRGPSVRVSEAVVELLQRRARRLGLELTPELEAYDADLYGRIYWMVCGVSDYLEPLLAQHEGLEK